MQDTSEPFDVCLATELTRWGRSDRIRQAVLNVLGTVCTMMRIASLQSQTHNSVKAKNGMVITLDGTRFFGFIEILDDYTIRISNDSGITRLPPSSKQALPALEPIKDLSEMLASRWLPNFIAQSISFNDATFFRIVQDAANPE